MYWTTLGRALAPCKIPEICERRICNEVPVNTEQYLETYFYKFVCIFIWLHGFLPVSSTFFQFFPLSSGRNWKKHLFSSFFHSSRKKAISSGSFRTLKAFEIQCTVPMKCCRTSHRLHTEDTVQHPTAATNCYNLKLCDDHGKGKSWSPKQHPNSQKNYYQQQFIFLGLHVLSQGIKPGTRLDPVRFSPPGFSQPTTFFPARIDIFKYSYIPRTIIDWNNLPPIFQIPGADPDQFKSATIKYISNQDKASNIKD